MRKRKLENALGGMREAWDRRARENARHYVATTQAEWSDEEFFRSGERTVADFIPNDMENICQGRVSQSIRVLEIGCGAGRVARALARQFGEVHAVDISGEMIRRARQVLAPFPNMHVYQNNGMDLSVVPDTPFDFAFSTIVFQHVLSRAIVERYFREVNRLLRPGGAVQTGRPGLDDSASPLVPPHGRHMPAVGSAEPTPPASGAEYLIRADRYPGRRPTSRRSKWV